MDDTPFINDGADTSLRKTVSLLNKIEAKTGSTTITGPVTVSNEVEITNDTGNPIPTTPDAGSIGSGIQYQLDNNGPITRPQDVGDGVQYYLDNYGNNIPITGTVTAEQSTSSSLKAQAQLLNSSGTVVDYATTGSAGTPSADVLSVQGISGGTALPISNTNLSNIDTDLGATSDSVASSDTGTFSIIAFIKRGMQNWTSLLAKLPALVSGRIPVDGSGVTQPTRETQPTGDYVINTGTAGTLSLSGSAVSTAGFDAGTTADYVAVTIEGGGASGGFYIDGSLDNATWTSGLYLSVYYDIPSNSTTDIYGYRTATGQLFGNTRSSYYGRFIVSCAQIVPFSSNNVTYRYFRITTPATTGGWRYKFASYKSPIYSIGYSNPGGATRVNGRVDVGYVTGGTIVATQSTNANLKGQAQILNSAGSLITYAESGTYGNPSVDVISVQNPQGTSPTIATFTSTTPSSTLVTATTARKTLTVYNSGAGDLYISPTATCTTTNFQVKLASGDYWECPEQQVTLGHTAVYATAGTAYVTTIS